MASCVSLTAWLRAPSAAHPPYRRLRAVWPGPARLAGRGLAGVFFVELFVERVVDRLVYPVERSLVERLARHVFEPHRAAAVDQGHAEAREQPGADQAVELDAEAGFALLHRLVAGEAGHARHVERTQAQERQDALAQRALVWHRAQAAERYARFEPAAVVQRDRERNRRIYQQRRRLLRRGGADGAA
jgi:hypothetical protein